jgi:hypothetical protein
MVASVAANVMRLAVTRASCRSSGLALRFQLFVNLQRAVSHDAAKRVEIAREAFPRTTVLGIAFDTISRERGGWMVARGVRRASGRRPRKRRRARVPRTRQTEP